MGHQLSGHQRTLPTLHAICQEYSTKYQWQQFPRFRNGHLPITLSDK